MGSTYLSLHYHLIFSTKNREPLIDATFQNRLYEYLAGTLHGLKAGPERIGGTADHVHILMWLRSTNCLADVVRELKRSSSVWVQTELGVSDFGWQDGYGAFTVSARSLPGVRRYIDNQETHHRVVSFREELIEMLKLANVKYDPRYLD